MAKSLRKFILKRLLPFVLGSSSDDVRYFVNQILAKKSSSLTPTEAAIFLFQLDNEAYELQGPVAIRAEGGIHPKHRITHYHDYFIARIGPGERVLDVGCRTGEVAAEIAERTGAVLTGIDIDEESLAIGRQRYPGLNLLQGDVYTWEPPHSFDVVLMSNVLEHLRDRSSLLKTLQERTSAKKFLIRVPSFERDWRVGYKRDLGIEWRLDHTHETEFTLETFASETEAGGLHIADIESRWGEIWAELKAI
jgi:SAM-dependent methyltransferase